MDMDVVEGCLDILPDEIAHFWWEARKGSGLFGSFRLPYCLEIPPDEIADFWCKARKGSQLFESFRLLCCLSRAAEIVR
jgi:hypothetical protein